MLPGPAEDHLQPLMPCLLPWIPLCRVQHQVVGGCRPNGTRTANSLSLQLLFLILAKAPGSLASHHPLVLPMTNVGYPQDSDRVSLQFPDHEVPWTNNAGGQRQQSRPFTIKTIPGQLKTGLPPPYRQPKHAQIARLLVGRICHRNLS